MIEKISSKGECDSLNVAGMGPGLMSIVRIFAQAHGATAGRRER
jgi:hypothetical protein